MEAAARQIACPAMRLEDQRENAAATVRTHRTGLSQAIRADPEVRTVVAGLLQRREIVDLAREGATFLPMSGA